VLVKALGSRRDPARHGKAEQRQGTDGAHHSHGIVKNVLEQPLIGQREHVAHVIEEPARNGDIDSPVAEHRA
jgi:hypothetical protein